MYAPKPQRVSAIIRTRHVTDRNIRRVSVIPFDHADKSFKADDSMHNTLDSELELCRLDISDQDHLGDCNTIRNPPFSYFPADPSYTLTPKFSPVTIETLRNSTYPYTSDLLSIDNCKPPESTPGIAIEGSTSINTPLIGSAWRTALSLHPDQDYASYIINGILNGVRIGFDHSNLPQSAESNMPSAHANPAIVVDYINTEVKERRVVGPLVRRNSPGVHISRSDVIPKHNQPGKWRLILDLSYPQDRSVNAGISKPLLSPVCICR